MKNSNFSLIGAKILGLATISLFPLSVAASEASTKCLGDKLSSENTVAAAKNLVEAFGGPVKAVDLLGAQQDLMRDIAAREDGYGSSSSFSAPAVLRPQSTPQYAPTPYVKPKSGSVAEKYSTNPRDYVPRNNGNTQQGGRGGYNY